MRSRNKGLTSAGTPAFVNILLSVARSTENDASARLDALDELSEIFFSAEHPDEASKADPLTLAENASKFLKENLEVVLFPALNAIIKDENEAVARRATDLLARIGASLEADAWPFFSGLLRVLDNFEKKSAYSQGLDQSLACRNLAIISRSLRFSSGSSLEPCASRITARLQCVLESLQSHLLVAPIVEVLQTIGARFPAVFSPVFKDVVDLMLGWSLDPNIPAPSRLQISSSFSEFRHLWTENLVFTESLLNKFVLDIEGLCYQGLELTSGFRSMDFVYEMEYLAMCFIGVIEGTGDVYIAEKHSSLYSRLILSFGKVSRISAAFRLEVCRGLSNLCCMLLTMKSPRARLIASHLLDQISKDDDETATLVKMIRMIENIFFSFDCRIDGSTLAEVLLGPSSSIPDLRMRTSPPVGLAVRSLYKALLGYARRQGIVSRILFIFLEEVYSCCSDIAKHVQSIQTDTVSPCEQFLSELEVKLVFIIGLIAEEIREKPETCDEEFLSRCLRCISPCFVSGTDVLALNHVKFYALTLLKIGLEQNRFVDSVLVQLTETLSGTISSNSSQGVKKLTCDVIKIVSKRFQERSSHHEASDVINALAAATSLQIHSLASDPDAQVRVYAAGCVVDLASAFFTDHLCAFKLIQSCVARLQDSNPIISRTYLSLLGRISHLLLIHPPRLFCKLSSADLGVHDYQRDFLKFNVSSMRTVDFQRFIGYISQRVTLEISLFFPRAWSISQSLPGPRSGREGIPQELEGWAVVEAARFCVKSRLRTSFGGPMQTFEALEHMLLEASARGELELRATASAGHSTNRQDAVRMLLNFLAHLERQVYNAFEGSVNLPASSASSIKFFRGNKKVCEDWFFRLRKSLVQTSLVANAPFHLLEFSSKRISELYRILSKSAIPREEGKKFKTELDQLVLSYLSALLDVRDSDAVDGFAVWAKTALKPLGIGVKDCAGWIQALSLQCRGRLQEAEEHYQKNLLSQSLHPEVYFFIIKNAAHCCIEMANWKKWEEWGKRFQELISQDRMLEDVQFSSSKRQVQDLFHSDLFSAMMHFDVGNFLQADDRISRIPDVEPKDVRDLRECLDLSESYLLKSLISIKRNRLHDTLATIERSCDMVLEPIRMTSSDVGCQLQAASVPAIILSCCAYVKESLQAKRGVGSSAAHCASVTKMSVDFHKCDSSLQDVGLLNRLLRVIKAVSREEESAPLMLQISKIARRQGNLEFAEELLTRHVAALSSRYEKALLLLAKGQAIQGFQEMWKLLLDIREASMRDVQSVEGSSISEKILIKVAKLLQDKSFAKIQEQESDIFGGITTFCSGNGFDLWSGAMGMLSTRSDDLELVSGFFLHQCTSLHPQLTKGWAEYASWCYRQGRRQMDWTAKSTSAAVPPGLVAQRARIKGVLIDSGESNVLGGMDVSVDEMTDRIGDIFAANNGDETGLDPSSEVHMSSVRRACESALPLAESTSVESLVSIWQSSRSHVLSLYISAAKGYFEYLRLGQRSPESSESRSARVESVDITATLRLLRLLVKYGDSIPVFAENISTTPTLPWRTIVPQLFARLGHADSSVRQRVQTLIMRIGAASPHTVVYPTIVGFEENSASRELAGLLDTLRSARPELVNAVQRVIQELARCAVLKEDDLLCELQEVAQIVGSGMRLMRDEVARVRDNATLSEQERLRILREKYDAIMKPADLALDRLKRVFASVADCDHDRAFYALHHSAFTDALKAFRTPDVYSPSSAWEPMKAIIKSLAKQVRRGSLTLSSISPYLASLHSTDIPLPGVAFDAEADDARRVTVASFESRVELLMTKTKPKKITVRGSDGRSYTYLLKGREDLHLDERMMQFLEIVNKFLRQDQASDCRALRARHYAVIPLGPRSGLIQWADGTVPLCGVYKAWQARQQPGDGGARDAALPRPSDLFYEKIMPALKEFGISHITSRRDWPVEVLRTVFAQLVQETPRELLAREIQCSCLSSAELWAKTNGHARSVAVMSMVGYVIGLGDRHLDNILMDFRSGEVVHIDWNVCFEKGSRLKVPEVVPFRMTHTMQAAMGLAGVEGAFRIACEKSLRVLRRNKEALLTLLEAFVYDPLVDWTAEKEAQQASKSVELHVSLSLFASRVDEMKVSLAENLRQGTVSLADFQQLLGRIVDLYASDIAGRLDSEELASTVQGLDQKLADLSWEEGGLSKVLSDCASLQPHVEAHWARAKRAVEERLGMCAQGSAQQSAAVSFVRATPIPSHLDQARAWLA